MAFEQHQQNINNLAWSGAAKDAALRRVTSDLAVARRQAGVQREASVIAERGADDIQSARGEVLEAIQEAEAQGFRVSEDLSVSDTRAYEAHTAGTRIIAAVECSEDIRWRAEKLLQTDVLVGNQLDIKASELAGILFDGEHSRSDATGDRIQLVDNEIQLGPVDDANPPLSESRRRALEYSEKWAEGFNPAYESLGGGDLDCTNFASQVMRAGGFDDVGNGIDDWRRGDSDDWYYQNDGAIFPGNTSSKTWTLAKEQHNFVTQHSGRGEIVGVVPTPSRDGLDPLAPSKAGLLPGDLIYYKDADGGINHVAVYAGQQTINGVPTDVINQHSGGIKLHGDWMPDSEEYTQAPAQVEFVHLRYPGE
ncbi:amidase domain-containing protein [Mycolicibacterium sp. A43C]